MYGCQYKRDRKILLSLLSLLLLLLLLLLLFMAATVWENLGKNKNSSRSGKSQGIF